MPLRLSGVLSDPTADNGVSRKEAGIDDGHACKDEHERTLQRQGNT